MHPNPFALPVYFFTPEELREIFNAGPAPSPPIPSPAANAAFSTEEAGNGTVDVSLTDAADAQSQSGSKEEGPFDFDTLQMALDRRMLVNRKEDKKMYRNWIQTKLRKR